MALRKNRRWGAALGWAWLVLPPTLAHAGGQQKLDPAVALSRLGGLAAPLEAEGWTLTPFRGSLVEPGDVLDRVDNQILVRGADCFAPTAIRAGLGVSATLSKSLSVGVAAPVGAGRAGAHADGKLDVAIEKVEIAEIPVAAMKPVSACVDVLLLLANQGYDLSQVAVVQSVLWADIQLAGCVGGGVSAGTAVAGVQYSQDACHGLAGARTALGVRLEAASTALALAGVDVDAIPPAATFSAKACKQKQHLAAGVAPCPPYSRETHLVAIGRGASLTAADADARAQLIGPFERRFQAVLASVGGDEKWEAVARKQQQDLMAAIELPERLEADGQYYSLAVLERERRAAAVAAELSGVERHLRSLDATAPWAAAQQYCQAVPKAQEAAFLHLVQSGLKNTPSRPSVSHLALEEKCAEARTALRIAVPDDATGRALAVGLSALGLQVVPADDSNAHLRVVVEAVPRRAIVSGMTSITLEGTARLLADGYATQQWAVQGLGASSNADKATEMAARELASSAASTVLTAIREGLGQ